MKIHEALFWFSFRIQVHPLIWKSFTYIVGCHILDHYEAGMKGTLQSHKQISRNFYIFKLCRNDIVIPFWIYFLSSQNGIGISST